MRTERNARTEVSGTGRFAGRRGRAGAASARSDAVVSDVRPRRVSVIIPARNEEASIGGIVRAVLAQRGRETETELEVVVAVDASTDDTEGAARAAGARTLCVPWSGAGNPGAARNFAAREATGDLLVFLDADCMPSDGWLGRLLDAHGRGEAVVGGALDLPPGLPFSARCDYYCGWYHMHSRRRPGYVVSHPPGNLSVRRDLFLSTRGFEERHPIAFAHEELGWQGEVIGRGVRIYFEPRAIVLHRNRPGLGNMLARNYRWGYSAIESKALTGAARMAWLYRHPRVLIALGPASALAQAIYIVVCWLRAGVFTPLLMLPAVLAARAAYAIGMMIGGIRWLRSRRVPASAETRPRWV